MRTSELATEEQVALNVLTRMHKEGGDVASYLFDLSGKAELTDDDWIILQAVPALAELGYINYTKDAQGNEYFGDLTLLGLCYFDDMRSKQKAEKRREEEARKWQS